MAINITVRHVQAKDAEALSLLLNEIIVRGGTTALEEPFSAAALAKAFLIGPDVICCFVASDRETGRLVGFQMLERNAALPDGIADIGTFIRVGLTQAGVGSLLFAATCVRIRNAGLKAINATTRADNVGGLIFYSKLGFADFEIQRALPLKDGTTVDRVSKRYLL